MFLKEMCMSVVQKKYPLIITEGRPMRNLPNTRKQHGNTKITDIYIKYSLCYAIIILLQRSSIYVYIIILSSAETVIILFSALRVFVILLRLGYYLLFYNLQIVICVCEKKYSFFGNSWKICSTHIPVTITRLALYCHHFVSCLAITVL